MGGIEVFGGADGLEFGSILLGDIDGDGFLDAIGVPEARGQALRFFAGTEGGGFTSSSSLPLEAAVAALEDLDGDRALDLVLLDHDGQTLSIAFGVGDGSFEEAAPVFSIPPLEEGTPLPALTVDDWNGDGQPDIIAMNRGIRILYANEGDRVFKELWRDPFDFAGVDLVLGRDNRRSDGAKELYVTHLDMDTVFERSPSAGGFADSYVQNKLIATGYEDFNARRLIAIDVNDDDYDDLIVGSSLGFFVIKSKPVGSFYPEEFVPSRSAELVVGTTDTAFEGAIVAGYARSSQELEIIEFPSHGGPSHHRRIFVGEATALAMAPLRGTGTLDVVLSTPEGQILVVRGEVRADGVRWTAPLLSDAGAGAHLVQRAVLGGEGTDNLIVALEGEERLRIYTGERRQNFDSVELGGTPSSLLIEDLSGDGALDLLVGVETDEGERVVIFENDGEGGFGGGHSLDLGFPYDLQVLAVPGGGPALVVSDGTTGDVTILRRTNAGKYEVSQTIGIGQGSAGALGLLDADCDGRTDVLVANKETGSIVTLRDQGDGTFVVASSFEAAPHPVGLAAWSTEVGAIVAIASEAQGTVESYFLDSAGKATHRGTVKIPGAEGGGALAGLRPISLACSGAVGGWVAVGNDGFAALGQVDEKGEVEVLQSLGATAPLLGMAFQVLDQDGDGVDDLVIPHKLGEDVWLTIWPSTCQ